MSTNDQNEASVRRLMEQQVKLRSSGMDQQVRIPSSGDEVRKGVNVLQTSNPKNPAPNPFVQAQNQGGGQGKQSGAGAGNKGKSSE